MAVTAEEALNPAENLEGSLSRFARVVEVPQEERTNSHGYAGEDQAEHSNSIDAPVKNVDVRFITVIALPMPRRPPGNVREAGAFPSGR